LYTWEAAMKACPKGWHLPRSKEWADMLLHYGEFALDNGVPIYKSLIEGGDSHFSAVLGGSGFEGNDFDDLEEMGTYWTSTEIEPGDDFTWQFYFMKNRKKVDMSDYGKDYYFSARYVKNKD